MRYYFTICLLLSALQTTFGQDSLKVQLEKGWSPRVRYNNFMLVNPAIRSWYDMPYYTELVAEFDLSDGKATIQQEGTHNKRSMLSVQTSQKMGREKRIWGNVAYVNGKKDGVRWNESADYATVYPYVIADTVGRSNLQHEKYLFSGGYAQLNGRIGYGIQIDYSALKEYRSIDPRPNNTVSNLYLKGGLTYALNESYTVGVGGFWQKYKQDNIIQFRSQIGIPMVYHASGLGSDMYLFSGKAQAYTTLYDGSGYDINIQLFPTRNNGWGVNAEYSNFSYKKELNNLLYLPVSSLKSSNYKLMMTYQRGNSRSWKGVKLELDYQKRNGIENIFYVPQTDIYEEISTVEMYAHDLYSGIISFSYGITGRSSWVFTPFIGINDSKETYKEPSRKMSFTNLRYGLQAHALLKQKRVLIRPEIRLLLNNNLNKEWLMTDLPKASYVYGVYKDNYTYLTENSFSLKANVRSDYMFGSKYALFLKIEGEYASYTQALHYSNFSIACGFVF